MPDMWRYCVITPVFKKEDKMKCSNYRGIGVLNVAYKILYKVLCTSRIWKIPSENANAAVSNTVLRDSINKKKFFNEYNFYFFILLTYLNGSSN
jgi:hypothetical protein